MFDSVYQKALSGDLESVELLEDMANKGKIAVENAAIRRRKKKGTSRVLRLFVM